MAQDRDQWQVLENMVIDLWVPKKKAGNFFTT
jgi:hypothetical protein